MKNYDPHSTEIFKTTEREILNQPKAWVYTKEKYSYNLTLIKKYFQASYGLKVIDFTVCKLPYKKSKYDNGVLLCFVTDDFKYLAKRFHNNQYLTIEY